MSGLTGLIHGYLSGCCAMPLSVCTPGVSTPTEAVVLVLMECDLIPVFPVTACAFRVGLIGCAAGGACCVCCGALPGLLCAMRSTDATTISAKRRDVGLNMTYPT